MHDSDITSVDWLQVLSWIEGIYMAKEPRCLLHFLFV